MFWLDVSAFVLQLFLITLVLQELFVFLKFDLISFTPHLIWFLDMVLCSSFSFIKISPQLLYHIAISFIIGPWLQTLILEHKVVDFSLVSVFYVADFFFVFIFVCFKLGTKDIKLSFWFVELVRKPFVFIHFLLQIDSMAGFKILLNFHPQNISINRQRQLLSHRVHFSLFHFHKSPHIRQSPFKINFNFLSRLNFLTESFLISAQLFFNLIIMSSEIIIKCIDLVFLGYNMEKLKVLKM